MNTYRFIRPLLFACDAEWIHGVVLRLIGWLPAIVWRQVPADPVTLAGLSFQNRVGLAAGLDKNGDYVDALGRLGFGFIEVGTVTPLPQSGNPRPRLFRLPRSSALINRMGFNNKGVDYLVSRIKSRRYTGILGVNIGKNAITPIEDATSDYLLCLEKVLPYCDYITLNISSPNTPGLRSLQQTPLFDLLTAVCARRDALCQALKRNCPLFVKLAPDLDATQIAQMAQTLSLFPIAGVIVSNTTITRIGVDPAEQSMAERENGGLSGAPLRALSTQILSQFRQALPTDMVMIAAGGIASGEVADEKRQHGADLFQIYTGFIYEGPSLVSNISSYIKRSANV